MFSYLFRVSKLKIKDFFEKSTTKVKKSSNFKFLHFTRKLYKSIETLMTNAF